jgi:hypothetical protein
VAVRLAVKLLETTPPTVAKTVAFLESQGKPRESSGRKPKQTFSLKRYLELLWGEMK